MSECAGTAHSNANPGAVFLSGPMSGLPGDNRERFNYYAKRLRDAGWLVWNPAELPHGLPWGAYMSLNVAALTLGYGFCCRFDYVGQLPGWVASRGARIESYIALEMNIPHVPVHELC